MRFKITVIVYKDGIIASDTLISQDTTKWSYVKKIAKTDDGCLIGAAGNLKFLQEFLFWGSLKDRDSFKVPMMKDSSGILITPKREIFLYEGTQHATRILSPYVCIGSGATVALGAIFMGASAVEAVRAAITYDSMCDGEIYVETL